MSIYSHFVGIDCSKDQFAAAVLTRPDQPIAVKADITNNPEGFAILQTWLKQHGSTPENTQICVEATGVYSESLCYYLAGKGFPVALEGSQRVKRAFRQTHKNDPVDARQIAEYAYRFKDQLKAWHPRSDILEEINTLLVIREQLVAQRTALKNTQQAFARKVVQSNMANRICRQNIARLDKQIKALETEMQKQVAKDTNFAQIVALLDSVPGIGLLLALNLLVVTNAFTNISSYSTLAAYVGVCPLQHISGSSVRKRSKSSGMGPSRIRKLLHLAAKSLAGNKPLFKTYALRKMAQGKASRLIFNNIGNKILRIACAVIKDRKSYDPKYISINPILLKKRLTSS